MINSYLIKCVLRHYFYKYVTSYEKSTFNLKFKIKVLHIRIQYYINTYIS